jgi:hypothetical protein
MQCGPATALFEFFALGWLHAERPSEPTLAYSAEILFFHIVWRCLYYVAETVDVCAGLLGKEYVQAIISSVRLEMDEIKKENGMWLESATSPDRRGFLPPAALRELRKVASCARFTRQNNFRCGSQHSATGSTATHR